jgi:hypothetical protein
LPSQQLAEQAAGGAPQSVPAASPYSLAMFKDFMAHRGSANLSDKDVEKLYAEFLEWNSHANN